MISNYLCPLCEDKNVNKRLVNTSLYWIGQCEICGKIIIASQEHVSNVEDDVFIEMKQECKSLLGNHDYDINLEDSHKEYLGHFHFHLEPIRETVKEPEVSKEPTEEAKKETPAAKAEVKVEETNKSDKPKKV
ncbi:MAG: hypothetical protein KKH70_20610, partial [Gammaproteobacteria bacterium]|nr:hypothetical protein [Gammaproteobacteria bacterium]